MTDGTPAPLDPRVTGGAADSLGLVQSPLDTGGRPPPATRESFDNSGGYLDQSGTYRPNLNSEQLAEWRGRWIANFDRRATEAKFHGRDLADFSPEARAAHIAKFDNAARADGLNPVEAPAAELVQAHQEFGLPIGTPQPDQYRPTFAREFVNGKDASGQSMTPERLKDIHTELTSFAAAMRFRPTFGTSIIERLAEIGPKIRAMDENARSAWIVAQNRVTLQRVGSEAALDQLKADARAALGVAKGNKLAALLAESPHLNDAWLLATLAIHGRALQAFAKKYPALAGRTQ
jgi:hypothetical protein